MLTKLTIVSIAALVAPAPSLASGAHSGRKTFGGTPLPISLGPHGAPANGDSSGAAVSGDDRKTRLAAFHSAASNLVAGDTNGRVDVFVWQRPRGQAGLRLARPGGALKRASVNSRGGQANGDSINPSLDGSLRSKPHCVAFQSAASNLAPGDRDANWDVYVRDMRRRSTLLASRGIGPAAVNPSINGRCTQLAFEAGGSVYVAGARGGSPRRIAPGTQPSFSRDGSALVWTSGGSVKIRRAGHTTKVGPGVNPRVSDEESGAWGVSFDTAARLNRRDGDSTTDVYTRVVRRVGAARRTDLISTAPGGSAYNGGITSYGTNRGIIVFGIAEGSGSGIWYRNNHTGNIDDLAFTQTGSLTGIATSARANFVAFSSDRSLSRYDRSPHADVYFKHTKGGEPY
jgi:hypothetical protein